MKNRNKKLKLLTKNREEQQQQKHPITIRKIQIKESYDEMTIIDINPDTHSTYTISFCLGSIRRFFHFYFFCSLDNVD